jgi:hypothetical protein
MDEQQRASTLGDIAADAGRKRERFLGDAGREFARFVDGNKRRLQDLGGLVLIDDEPEYLFVTEEGTFRSRTRYQDEDGQWVAESEEIDDPSELVELYNLADLYAAFADAARDEAEADADREAGTAVAEDEAVEPEPEEEAEAEEDEEAEAEAEFDDWPISVPTPRDKPDAARILYDLALTFQERSQLDQADLLDDFQEAAAPLAEMLGDNKILEDEDERLWFRASGAFEGEVVPEHDGEDEGEGEPQWQTLTTARDFVQYYDPTDLFGDLAEAIAEAYPGVAPELEEDEGDAGSRQNVEA